MICSKLDKLITIEKYTPTKNEYGELINTYVKVKDIYSTVRVENGGVVYDKIGALVVANIEFSTRYYTDIDYQCRIKYNNEYYKILYIEEIGRKSGLKLKTILFEDE